MTREEQIEQQALLDENAYVDNNYFAFKRGVEWADKHPKKGLISLEDAVSWLEEQFDKFKTEDGRPMTFCNKKDFIKAFKKAMSNE